MIKKEGKFLKIIFLIILFVGLESFSYKSTENQKEEGLISISNASPVSIKARNFFLKGRLFIIRGIGYSPVPIGIDPETTPPYGDYFTLAYSAIYNRDLPLIRNMGANTIRLWGWNNTADHTDFLNKAYNNGKYPIYVIITFWMGPSVYPDISSKDARTRIKCDFRNMVSIHKNHPAVLMWCIGNELNAPWMYGNNLDDLFSLINEMAQEAHLEEGANYHPVMTALADINVINTIRIYNPSMTYLDCWGVNIYRGSSFGNFFAEYSSVSQKPLVITEYGIDAFDNRIGNEYELSGSALQADYASSLWREISQNYNICVGGCIMAYCDEWWKGKYSENITGCPDYDPSYHSTCGYPTYAHPDGFSNEEWWGIMRTKDNGSNPDIMEPRAVYWSFKALWTRSLIGVYINGKWYIDFSSNGLWDGTNIDIFYTFGSSGYVPVTGDWNGDGRTEIGTFVNGKNWFLDYNGNGAWDGTSVDKSYVFGAEGVGFIPVTGDWNGDGKTEIGVFVNGNWYLDYNGNGTWDGTTTDRAFHFGSSGYVPVVGDWNGDGKTEIGVVYGGKNWFLDYNGNGVWDGASVDKSYAFGASGYVSVTGDWNGDGKTEIGVFVNGNWFVDYNGNGTWDGTTTDRAYHFGSSGYLPVVGRW